VLAVQKSRKPAWVRSRISGQPYRPRLRLLRVMPAGPVNRTLRREDVDVDAARTDGGRSALP